METFRVGPSSATSCGCLNLLWVGVSKNGSYEILSAPGKTEDRNSSQLIEAGFNYRIHRKPWENLGVAVAFLGQLPPRLF
jgi:hypothetical protein